MRAILILSLVALLLVTGCTQTTTVEFPSKNETTPQQFTGKPAFEILTPQSNGTIYADVNGTVNVDLTLSITNLIIKSVDVNAKDGEGHFNVYVDSKNPKEVYSKWFTLEGVSLGSHIITIELVKNDRSSYAPRILRSVLITVESAAKSSATYEVNISDTFYTPEVLQITVGDAVSWTNTGKSPQTVTSKDNFDSGVLVTGQTYSRKFNDAGEYNYQSSNYGLAKGKIIVREN
ncbi:MAG: cupredoxin domain-containing protein [Candidatus Micrarchaeota archaeon]|nr:cupredoxin domain-containing protein [Candidatus Micrarchaeota archaeon]